MKKLILALLLTAAPAFAQAPAAPTTPAAPETATPPPATATPPAAKPKPMSAGEKKFLKDSLDGMFFVLELVGKAKTGAIAPVTKTESAALKTDLDKVWAEVAGVASANGETAIIPIALAGGDKSKAERLTKAGKNFDKEFYKLVNHEVEKMAKDFESTAKSSQDAETKKVAGNWAPTIRGHVAKLDAAEKEAAKAK